jgi:hypothetical protein
MSGPEVKRKVRCAVYTRKSSEEGLGLAFNSLDAQREACAAYIDSQRHEGWLALDDRYDDGGYSGGTLERPALQRLIRDIEAGKVDNVICYKIDRLSRSLTDFAKLVEVFERNSVTFVSVTQSFCTTTSMGRLTLNILLSFAQFERELLILCVSGWSFSVCERDSKRPISRSRGGIERGSATAPLGCPNRKGELSLYALAKSAVAASQLCYSPPCGEGRNGRRLALARGARAWPPCQGFRR